MSISNQTIASYAMSLGAFRSVFMTNSNLSSTAALFFDMLHNCFI